MLLNDCYAGKSRTHGPLRPILRTRFVRHWICSQHQRTKSRSIVSDAITMLENMEHRGGQGANPRAAMGQASGQVPHSFLKDAVAPLGFDLPVAGAYGVGATFFPKDGLQKKCRSSSRNTFEMTSSSSGTGKFPSILNPSRPVPGLRAGPHSIFRVPGTTPRQRHLSANWSCCASMPTARFTSYFLRPTTAFTSVH